MNMPVLGTITVGTPAVEEAVCEVMSGLCMSNALPVPFTGHEV